VLDEPAKTGTTGLLAMSVYVGRTPRTWGLQAFYFILLNSAHTICRFSPAQTEASARSLAESYQTYRSLELAVLCAERIEFLISDSADV
jgi:hypothetical protein